MALPVFRNASAKAAGTGAVTPALPASMVAGDIVLLCASTIAGGSISITAVGSIATWTEITSGGIDVASGEKLYVWWGRWTSGSTGPTVTPGGDHCCAGTVAYSGCVPNGSPIDVSATGTEVTSDASFSFATGLTTGENDCMCICVCTSGVDSNTAQVPVMANASLAALASRMDFCTSSGLGGGFGLSEGTKATAGTMGTFTATLAGSSPKAYVAFSLRPLVAVTTSSGVGVLTLTGLASVIALKITSGVGVITLVGFAPLVNLKIIADLGTLSMTGFAPTVTASNNQVVTSSVGVLSITGLAPTISVTNNQTVSSSLGALTVAGFAPTVSATANQIVSTAVASITVTGVTPTVSISDNKTISADTGILVLTGFAPSIGLKIIADIGGLVVAGYSSTVSVSDNQNISAGIGTLIVSGFAPQVNQKVMTGLGALIVTGLVPTINISDNVTIAVSVGELTITAYSPTTTTSNHQIVLAGYGECQLTGISPHIGIGIITENGEIALGGFAPTISISDQGSAMVVAQTGQLLIIGIAPTVTSATLILDSSVVLTQRELSTVTEEYFKESTVLGMIDKQSLI